MRKDTGSLVKRVGYKHVQGGNVPGGHNVIWDGERKPFITPMAECNSISLRHSDVVVDIGAYVGTYCIRCARHPCKQVIAYEPTPTTFSILSLTHLPNLTCIQSAIVADSRPSVDLFISSGIGVTNSIVLSNKKAFSISVPAINYTLAVSSASIVKIDVEGAEYTYPIIQPSLRAIIIDFHPVPGDWEKAANHIMSDLADIGFITIRKPDFSCGWTRAGSWERPMETYGEYEPMMKGEECCGCGKQIKGKGKSLCRVCWDTWLPRHRDGFTCAEEK